TPTFHSKNSSFLQNRGTDSVRNVEEVSQLKQIIASTVRTVLSTMGNLQFTAPPVVHVSKIPGNIAIDVTDVFQPNSRMKNKIKPSRVKNKHKLFTDPE